ncbi:MAG TPA: hypothetical protein VLT47_10630 [Anaeromyxobacteraceae bacterium]|nr:hypothetical protein [Anaeromyxobacteraceae bacterium]
MEPLLDPSNPLHAVIVTVLILAGGVSIWLGIRDGFVRREMRTNSGLLSGTKAMLAGALYVATGLFSVLTGIASFLKARG